MDNKASKGDRENYVSVTVNHGGQMVKVKHGKQRGRRVYCSLALISLLLLALHLVAVRISVARGANEEGGRGGWGVTGNRRV